MNMQAANAPARDTPLHDIPAHDTPMAQAPLSRLGCPLGTLHRLNNKQSGMSFVGLVIVLVAVLSVVLAGIKIVPAYIEFMSVKKVIKKIADEPNLNDMSKKDIAIEFDKNANTSYVTVVTGKDLVFSKDETGKTVVSVDYQVVKPLAGNLSALMDFKATTEK